MIFIAILVAAVILGTGFLISLVAPRFVRWDMRTPAMVGIWLLTLALAVTSFVVIA